MKKFKIGLSLFLVIALIFCTIPIFSVSAQGVTEISGITDGGIYTKDTEVTVTDSDGIKSITVDGTEQIVAEEATTEGETIEETTEEVITTYTFTLVYSKGMREIVVTDANNEVTTAAVTGAGKDTNYTTVHTPLDMIPVAGTSTTIIPSTKDTIWKFMADDAYMNNYSGNKTMLTLSAELPKKEPIPDYSKCIKVASYNIRTLQDPTTGVYGDGLTAIVEEIAEVNPDIIGLQEVDNKTARSGYVDQTKLLADTLGYEYYYFGKATDKNGGEYGHALLSKYPIISSETVLFDTQLGGNYETRSYESHVIDINGILINVYNTHLCQHTTDIPIGQLSEILQLATKQEYAIIMGDTNMEPTEFSGAIDKSKLIVLNGGETYSKPKYTYPAGTNSSLPIDNIIVTRTFKHYWEEENDSGIIVNVTDNSDHNMIYTYLDFGATVNDIDSYYTVNHGITAVTLGSNGSKGNSGTKRNITFHFENTDEKMKLGFTVPKGENGVYEISAPISVSGDGKVTYSVIKETASGIRSYLQAERVYENKSINLLNDTLCDLFTTLNVGDTVWIEAYTDTVGTSVNIGIPKAIKHKNYTDNGGTQTLTSYAIDNLEYISDDSDKYNDIGYTYGNDKASLINHASVWRSGYFADFVTAATDDPFGISALAAGDNATDLAGEFSSFDFCRSSGNYFGTSYTTRTSEGGDPGSLYSKAGSYANKKFSIRAGYATYNGGYNAGIFHEFTVPVDCTAKVAYPLNSSLSAITLIKDAESGKYTVSTAGRTGSGTKSETFTLKKGDSVVVCYYRINSNAVAELVSPYVTMTANLSEVTFDKSTAYNQNSAITSLTANGTEITLPTTCEGIPKGYYLAGWSDDEGNEYAENSKYTVNGSTELTAVFEECGDVDRSGKIDSLDISAIRKHLVGLEVEIYERAADIDADSGINIKDLVALKKKLVGKIS